MSKKKTPNKTIWQLDQERPTNCPNFGTRRSCGGQAAVQGGCKVGPCEVALKQAQQVQELREKKREESAKAAAAPTKATPRKLMSHNIEAYLEQQARLNEVREHGVIENNWMWHTEKCCSRVWRPVSFPCLPRVAAQLVS